MDLGDLRYFMALARYGRLSAAADRLEVEHTTIRRRVSSLEKSLGTRLFDKSSSGWTLTVAGQRLLPYATRIEQEADAAQCSLRDGQESIKGTVRIVATDGFGSLVVAPGIASLQARHPSIEVDLVTTSHVLSYGVGEFDIAVTIGDVPERRGFQQTHLCDYELRLYATNAYLQSNPPITSLDDLSAHKMIWYVESLLQLPELRERENQEIAAQTKILFRTTNLFAQLEATAAGVGLGLLPCFAAQHDSRLLPVLHDEVRPRRSFWMVMPSRLLNAELITTFAGHLFQTVQRQSQRFIPD
ncbi:LysR family transcriptional regulator [Mycobacterium sp. smrl_JER01]|uniref:LysR family transcriptional regulator n=1 Tax=Mycobacterium sp. smrl_JER01 TaxID=3402633 RepID=UPI003AD3B06D